MQTLDDAIIDFTPPLPKRCVQEYYRHFVYKQVDAQCYVDGCSRPLMSKSYWVEKDKKVNPHSPTLMYSEPWPPRIRKRKRRTRKCRTVNVGGSLWSLLKGAARVGVQLCKSKRYQRMGALGVGGAVSNFWRKPWAV